ncbi:MAG: type II secretion system F family protein [Bacillota bacterium]|nr:type II secretion system F family protein [Bacillota bacterium]
MALNYTTKEIDLNGKVVSGLYEADSPEAVAHMIREKGHRPIRIEVQKISIASKELNLFPKKAKVKELAIFCRQLHTMLHAGMPLLACLDVLEQQQTNKQFAGVIRDLSIRVQKGEILSDAMRSHGNYFPEILLSMVASGELTGNLDEVMERMAVHFIKEQKINNKIKSATRYPIIVAVFALGAVVFLMTNVVPTFVELFEGSGSELPGITAFVISVSDSMVAGWWIYLLVIVGLVVGVKLALKNKEIKLQFDRLKFLIPGIKKSISQIVTSRFTRTMSTLLSAGIPLLAAIESAGVVTGNTYAMKQLEAVTEDVRKGVPLAPLLARTNLFPKMMTSMVSIGEESGSLEEMLEKTADYFDEELDAAITALLAMLEPIMIVVVGGIVGFVVIAMMLPMLTLFSTIQ